ncbi:MAG: NAD-dependent epimerase/dehydratase family protein [Sandaracinaceae bacterium]
MTRVLVTGATTPLGVALVERLLASDTTEHVLAVGVEPRWRGVGGGDRLTYRVADLTRPRRVRRLLFGPARDLGIEVLVHGPLHRSARDRGRHVRQLNVESTRALLELAEDHPALRRLVFRSFAEVYRMQSDLGCLISESHPLDLSPGRPQRMRDRVEADLTVCGRMGLTQDLSIIVLRCAEVMAPSSGSQLHDYLQSRVCFRPLGFDPMIQVLSLEDAARVLALAIGSDREGVFNAAGLDVLPLSRAIQLSGQTEVPVPGPLLGPLYAARSMTRGTEFQYGLNKARFHFSGVLDGRRAADELGYTPENPVEWASVAPSRERR